MALVVGAALICDGRLLGVRRTFPADLAGRWELPGGKVEPHEDSDQALVRELREELGIEVAIEEWLPFANRIEGDLLLVVARVSVLSGKPEPTEHDELRWLTAGELDDVDWLEPDRPFLEVLRPMLA